MKLSHAARDAVLAVAPLTAHGAAAAQPTACRPVPRRPSHRFANPPTTVPRSPTASSTTPQHVRAPGLEVRTDTAHTSVVSVRQAPTFTRDDNALSVGNRVMTALVLDYAHGGPR
jgi:hypothetical protein